MSSIRNPGRVAGFLYLLLAAPFRLIYIPSTLFVSGNATATTSNIAAHETLFRLGMVADLFCGTILIFLVLALYRLFKGVDQFHAALMVIAGGALPSANGFAYLALSFTGTFLPQYLSDQFKTSQWLSNQNQPLNWLVKGFELCWQDAF